MKKIIIDETKKNSDILNSLLNYFIDSDLKYNSSSELYFEKARNFLNSIHLDNKNKEALLREKSFFKNDTLVFPTDFNEVMKLHFKIGFDNFFVTVKDELNNVVADSAFEGSVRQPSPPLKAYTPIGITGEIKSYNNDYSFLED